MSFEESSDSREADDVAQQVLPSERGGVKKRVIVQRPAAQQAKSPSIVSESKAFGMVKLLRCTEKSYVLKEGKRGLWPQLVEVRKEICPAHQIAAKMLFDLSIDDASLTKESLVGMRETCCMRAMVQYKKEQAKNEEKVAKQEQAKKDQAKKGGKEAKKDVKREKNADVKKEKAKQKEKEKKNEDDVEDAMAFFGVASKSASSTGKTQKKGNDDELDDDDNDDVVQRAKTSDINLEDYFDGPW